MNFLRWMVLVFFVVLAYSIRIGDALPTDCGPGHLRPAQIVIDPFTMFARTETVLNLSVTANANDGEDLGGTWNGTKTAVNVGFAPAFGVFDGGCRFTGVNIPAGATIVSATFTIKVLAVNGSGADVIVRGRDVNNAAAWNGTGPATMAVTTANVTRTLGTVQTEVFDVKAILQEIVDGNSGTGNALSIGVLDNDTAGGNTCQFEALENAGANEATLDITYTS